MFFAIVLGVALVFKVGIGFAKPTAEAEPPAVARLSTTRHRDLKVTPVADPAAGPLPSTRAGVLHGATGTTAAPSEPSARPPRRRHRHSH